MWAEPHNIEYDPEEGDQEYHFKESEGGGSAGGSGSGDSSGGDGDNVVQFPGGGGSGVKGGSGGDGGSGDVGGSGDSGGKSKDGSEAGGSDKSAGSGKSDDPGKVKYDDDKPGEKEGKGGEGEDEKEKEGKDGENAPGEGEKPENGTPAGETPETAGDKPEGEQGEDGTPQETTPDNQEKGADKPDEKKPEDQSKDGTKPEKTPEKGDPSSDKKKDGKEGDKDKPGADANEEGPSRWQDKAQKYGDMASNAGKHINKGADRLGNMADRLGGKNSRLGRMGRNAAAKGKRLGRDLGKAGGGVSNAGKASNANTMGKAQDAASRIKGGKAAAGAGKAAQAGNAAKGAGQAAKAGKAAAETAQAAKAGSAMAKGASGNIGGAVAAGIEAAAEKLKKKGLLKSKASQKAVHYLIVVINIVALVAELISCIADFGLSIILFIINLIWFIWWLIKTKDYFTLGLGCCLGCLGIFPAIMPLIIFFLILLSAGSIFGAGGDANPNAPERTATPYTNTADIDDLIALRNSPSGGVTTANSRGANASSSWGNLGSGTGYGGTSLVGIRDAKKSCPNLTQLDTTNIKTVTNVNPYMDSMAAEALEAAAAEIKSATGKNLIISEAYRSAADQQAQYQRASNTSGYLAAAPGQSWHNSGFATDVPVASYGGFYSAPMNKVEEIMFRNGFDLIHESVNGAVHFQYIGGSSGTKKIIDTNTCNVNNLTSRSERRRCKNKTVNASRGQSNPENPYDYASQAFNNNCGSNSGTGSFEV